MWCGFVRCFSGRGLILLVAAVGLLAGLLVPGGGRAAVAAPPLVPGVLSGSEESVAVSRARSLGREVEVAGLLTETRRVVARPEGFLRAEVSPVPVRKRVGSGWRDLDARLVRGGGGRWVPAVSLSEVSISGGGSGPLVSIVRGGYRLELVWPSVLPVPVVDGDVATFAEVRAGVDLVVRVAPEGFSHFLVVKDLVAAEGLVAAPVDVGWRGVGVRVEGVEGGGLAAVTSGGEEIFAAAAPQMWAAASGSGPAPRSARSARSVGRSSAEVVRAPVSGREARVAASVVGDRLVLVPDRGVLLDPGTVFPVVVDPMWTEQRRSWAMVWSDGQFFRNPPGSTNARVGFDGWQGNKVSRTYYEMWAAGPWNNKQILSAQFKHLQIHSPNGGPNRVDCNLGDYGPKVQLGFTTAIPGDVSWGRQPVWLDTIAESGFGVGSSAYCGDKRPQVWDVTNWMRWASGRFEAITFGLRSANESNRDGWRQYAHEPVDPGGFAAPLLTIDYNSVPNTPPVPWVGTRDYPEGRFTNNSRPDFRSYVTDPDGDRVRVVHYIRQVSGPGEAPYPIVGFPSLPVASGDIAVSKPDFNLCNCTFDVWAVAEDVWPDGATKSRSGDSPVARFTVDTIKPAPPVIAASPARPMVGSVVQVMMNSASSDVRSYRWSVASDTMANRAEVPGGGLARVDYSDRNTGPRIVFASAEDRAGNVSDRAQFGDLVFVPPVSGHYYSLNGSGVDLPGVATAAEDLLLFEGVDLKAPGHGYFYDRDPANPVNDCSDTAFRVSSGYLRSAGLTVNSTESFSVTAWAQPEVLAASSGDRKGVVSIPLPGSWRNTAMVLGVHKNSAGQWVYALGVTPGDGNPVNTVWADSMVVAQPGAWAHLGGVYDKGAGTVRLFVNGSLAAETAITGHVGMGEFVAVGLAPPDAAGANAQWVGVVDEIRTYVGVMPSDEAFRLYTKVPNEVACQQPG